VGFAFDRDGRLRVADVPISKSAINKYLGKEIPNWERLGLAADQLYFLLRPADELRKSAASFCGVPLLSAHSTVTADEYPHELVIGTTGSDCRFDGPYLRNSICLWDQSAIDNVTSGAKRELSIGYSFDADMTAGVFEGQRYQGTIRNIVGNHVAIVKDGRNGAAVGIALDTALQRREAKVPPRALSLRPGRAAFKDRGASVFGYSVPDNATVAAYFPDSALIQI
jgi:uncharacterized protein